MPNTDTTTEAPVEDPSTAPQDEQPTEGGDTPEQPTEGSETDPETFPAEYVRRLRDESARYRQRAQRADDLGTALWTARVAATGRLADVTDLPMPEGADPMDTEAVTTAVEDLLARKPHLASRRPVGDVGQGAHGGADSDVDLAAIMRGRA